MIPARHKGLLAPLRPHLIPLLVALLLASSLLGQTVSPRDTSVTAVQGDSWLHQIRRPFNETSMGKTWVLGPAPPLPGEELPQLQIELSHTSGTQSVTLHGADLYRLNCQGCHAASGGGAPPEINSVINPVRATSVAVILERSKKTGQDMTRAAAAQLAGEAKALLLQRFQKGGQSMPAFPHLNQSEILSIVAYLEQLSEIPGAEHRQMAVSESDYRIGEHMVKSTCHICHAATGPNPTPQELMDGVIPPLSSLTRRTSLAEFVRKVTRGAPVIMGGSPFSIEDSYRGHMPVFAYFTEEEAADAYLYLTAYPPRP